MSERGVRSLVVVLALVGAAIAGYLSWTRLTDHSIMCPTTGCGTVQRSEYSTLAGLPVAYLGFLGYLAIAASAPRRRANALLVVFAAGFATYLLVAQLFFIHAVCVWCVGSDAVAYSLLVVTALRLYAGPRHGPPSRSDPQEARVRMWRSARSGSRA